ncbi:hypothetical protein FJT64_003679 [Amphibalanus amphitrite]|uniref:Apple domain-containing protein n=1 Tax=Amphibalanus amphitrite TaxID=1232801 RepID=A0A6A4VS40_AMPAM|nr:hypothetical protein FJT64_003679 [Amphibalanus amphitrite]
MERSGAHLLLPPPLLLTPVAAVHYRLQDAASFAGSRVHAAAAASALDCGLRCEGEPAQNCSGFTFEPANNTFSLYSDHCVESWPSPAWARCISQAVYIAFQPPTQTGGIRCG